jgi:hypothetical protein
MRSAANGLVVLAAVLLAACAPITQGLPNNAQGPPNALNGAPVVPVDATPFPAQRFSGVTLGCGDGTLIYMDPFPSATSFSFFLAPPGSNIHMTAHGGPRVFQAAENGATATFEFAADFRSFTLRYAIGPAPVTVTSCY